MARINVNLSGIERALLNRMADANAQAALSALRLATMSKINHPKDDPSAFMTLSRLQSDLSGASHAMANVTAASSMMTQAQTAMSQIQTQLSAIRTELLTDEDQGLTAQERVVSQAAIDAAIEQINTLANSSTGGRKILDGSAQYLIAGRNANQASDVLVRATGGATRTISGSVSAVATKASLTYTGASGQTTAAATFTLTGLKGSASISVTSGQSLSSVATAINNVSHDTGITASAAGDTLTFSSVDYGSDAQVAVQVTSGTFAVSGGGSVHGANGTAVINGTTYSGMSTRGNRYLVVDNGLVAEVEFASTFTGTFDSMTISGDALSFALSDNVAARSALAIPGLQAGQLSGPSGRLDELASGGSASGLGANTSRALRIVDEAIASVTAAQGTVSGFYNAAVTSASAYLTDLQTNLQDAIDSVDLVNAEEETARQTYYELLATNAASSLSVLNQQRALMVTLIKQIAGLI